MTPMLRSTKTRSASALRPHRAAIVLLLLASLGAVRAPAQEAGAAGVPDAAAALAAWEAFAADPPARLDRTGPFLEYIRNGGAVHIVLNDDVLGFMYGDLDDTRKAVLYAAFLGANMAAQLERGEPGSDNVAGMAGTLAAYRALRAADPTLEVAALEPFATAQANGTLDAAVHAAVTGTAAP